MSGSLKSGAPSAFALPGQANAILQAARATQVSQVFPERLYDTGKSSAANDLSSIFEVRFEGEIDVLKTINALRSQPGVTYAEPVYLYRLAYDPNDPASQQGFQNYLTTIHAREAWDLSKGDPSVIIAIVDTGVDWQHEDLAANIWNNADELPNNGVDDDNNGYIDDVRGWDFGGLAGTEDANPREDNPYHGTHVAGIAAAVTDNATGVASVGFNCKIMPVKTAQDNIKDSRGLPFIIHGYRGIVYAADNGASIINCSWSSPAFSQLGQDVINYALSKGALVVAAAGNDGSSSENYPAAFAGALAVAATNSSDVRTSFSNYGHWVSVAAPGQTIYSTWQPTTPTSSKYVYNSGTSMSSPVVAGVCALVKSVNPTWTPQQVGQQVRVSAANINATNPNYVKQLGFGRVDPFRALTISSPAVRWDSLLINEISGDGDGIIEPGETIAVKFRLVNYRLTANNLQVAVSTTSPNVNLTSSTLTLGALAEGQSLITPGQIVFTVAQNAKSNLRVNFLLDLTATGYADWQPFNLIVSPGNVQGGNAATTISSFGALGFWDYAGSGAQIGLGFQFPKGASTALFHGGFIVATAANRVSDVSYGRADGDINNNPRYDFAATPDGDITRRAGTLSSTEVRSKFTDSAAESPIGVQVTQIALAWDNPPYDDFVILQYDIKNTTASVLNNLYAGYYLDWDIIVAGANFAGWDPANQLGYMYATASNYYGVCAVAPANASSYRVIRNAAFDNSDAGKYQFFTGGFAVTSGNQADDWAQQIGLGPFTLQPGETRTVAFAMLGGTNLNDLKINAQAARAIYSPVGVEDNPLAPLRFELSQNQPNPFSIIAANQTVIGYTLAQDATVQVKIFNLLGQEVAVLREARQSAGAYRVNWNGRDSRGNAVPAGVYFYQVLAGNVRMVKRMVVLR